jgi:hypothetical protein
MKRASNFAALFFAVSGTYAWSYDAPERISGKVLDLGKVHKIYMVLGMATLVEIPSKVTGIRIGNPDHFQYFRPETPENEVTLVVKDPEAKPTNLIIRSNEKKYVFDLVPSKFIHQDTIEVMGSYGGASFKDDSIRVLDSSEMGAKNSPTEKKERSAK